MRRRPAALGLRHVGVWLLRSAIIVVVALAVYVALLYLVLPLVLD